MDPTTTNAVKRPRSLTPTSSKGGVVEPRKKKAKKKKDKSHQRSDSITTATTTTTTDLSTTALSTATTTAASQEKLRHHKDTATAEGHRMAQMLATMGTLEHSRFQAYKRSCFSADAVQTWVAACLQDRYGTTIPNNHPQQRKQRQLLSELVATGQACEIGVVVATAAKIYAQRLIADAIAYQKVHHQREGRKQQQQARNASSTSSVPSSATTTDTTTTTTTTTSAAGAAPNAVDATTTTPVVKWPTCTSVWKAVQERQRVGIDPGFFLQSDNWRFNAANVTTYNYHRMRRLAALSAQQAYDDDSNKRKQQQQQLDCSRADNSTTGDNGVPMEE